MNITDMSINRFQFLFLVLFISLPLFANGLLKRCFSCRSRGELGDCKDFFPYVNVTQLQDQHGVEAIPCASGWCGKILEGGNSFKDDDYGIATQRRCLQRGPSDSEERCAYTDWNNKKVYMCFCRGDLCNAGTSLQAATVISFVITFFTILKTF